MSDNKMLRALRIAESHIGVREAPGEANNPLIVSWGKAAGIDWYRKDADAWCAVAVGGWLAEAGLPTTSSALARSYMDWGIRIGEPIPGAVVVFPRGPNPLYGHVGIVKKVNGDGTIEIVNGNVSNMVKVSTRRVSEILPGGIRWAKDEPLPARVSASNPQSYKLGQRELSVGASGSDVRSVQLALASLGAPLEGSGWFGPKTEAAVRAFQQHEGDLVVDGVVGTNTITRLVQRAEESQAKKARGEAAKKAAAPGIVVGGAIGAGGAVTTGVEVAKDIKGLSDGTIVGGVFAVVILIAIVMFLVWKFVINRAKEEEAPDIVSSIDDEPLVSPRYRVTWPEPEDEGEVQAG